MADFRTKAVTPAAISYTPLDLSRVQGQLGKKVQDVEGAAAAGNSLMSQLNFKDGYMTAGLAKEKQSQYSSKIKNLVDGLYGSGDTRAFTSDLSLLANQINTDEKIKAGQKDYEFSKLHDARGLDPKNNKYYLSYTDDHSITGNINALNWKDEDLSEEDVQNAYKVYGGVDLYNDYSPMFKDLDSTTFEDYTGTDSNGFLVFKTTKGPTDLPQEIGDFTQAELAAQALKIKNPNLYRRLQSDFENAATNSASTYRDGMGESLDEFIGSAVLENLPFLVDTSYNLQNPPTDTTTPSGKDLVGGTVNLKTEAYITSIDQGAASVISAESGLSTEALAGVFNYGSRDAVSMAEVINNPSVSPEALSTVGFMAALFSDLDNNGDPTRPNLYTNGNELTASANEEISKIITTPLSLQSVSGEPGTNFRKASGEQGTPARESASTFVEVYKSVIGDQDSVEFFHKILNTRNLLGQIHSNGFDLDDKENLIADYDGDLNPELSNHITNGIGFLSPDELKGVLDILEEEQFSTTAITGSSKYMSSHLGSAINSYNKASDYYQDTKTGDYVKINREMPFTKDIEPYLMQIKESNPIAFNEMARVDMLHRASLYHTDVLIKPGMIYSNEVLKPAFKKTAEEFAAMGPVTLGQNFELFEIMPEAAGLSGTTSSGVSSPRLTKKNGTGVVNSPLQEVKWTSASGKKWLGDFQSYGTGTNPETLSFNLGGFLVPGGRPNDMGIVLTKTVGKNTSQWLLQPTNNTAMENNPLYSQLKSAKKSLTGKRYLPKVVTGDAYINQSGIKIYDSVQESVDLRNTNVDFYFTDTKAGLSGTMFFEPQENIMVEGASGTNATVTNPYFDGSVSVVADLQKGKEVYRLRSRDGTGDKTWGEYLDNFKKDIDDPANTYLGAQDYKDFVISLYLNQDFINENGGNITKSTVEGLLMKEELQSIQNITDMLKSDWQTLTNIPITFFDKKDAFYHFAGQPGRRREPDIHGNTQSGYMVK